MDIDVESRILCFCGKPFENSGGAWKKHQRSCKPGKKRLRSAIELARTAFTLKRQRLNTPIVPEHTSPPIHANSSGSSHQSDTAGPNFQPDVVVLGIIPPIVAPILELPRSEPATDILSIDMEIAPRIAEVKNHIS